MMSDVRSVVNVCFKEEQPNLTLCGDKRGVTSSKGSDCPGMSLGVGLAELGLRIRFFLKFIILIFFNYS